MRCRLLQWRRYIVVFVVYLFVCLLLLFVCLSSFWFRNKQLVDDRSEYKVERPGTGG